LERQLNFTRNLVADDSSFATRAIEVADEYLALCVEQYLSFPVTPETTGSLWQAAAARDQATQFSDDMRSRSLDKGFAETIAYHSSMDPVTGKCDAILVIPCSGVATAMLQRISSIDEQENLLKYFMLVQGPKPEKLDTGETSYQIEKTVGRSCKTTSDRSLQVLSSREPAPMKTNQTRLHSPLFYHPDGIQATQKEETTHSKNTSRDEPSAKDLLLPVLLAEYKKRDESAISTAMNQMKTYLVSAVTFLSEFGITDQPVFGLVVDGTLGAVTMAWKRNNVCTASVHHFRRSSSVI
jgi:hypothetical protein